MRDELKQREAELEKSTDDNQQMKNQVLTLQEGIQNLHAPPSPVVSTHTHRQSHTHTHSDTEASMHACTH